ncbi:hypothetical protein OE88DRAFT_1650269 [Heliocybe sulcata]|uniref:F-box domain-containing protein n=1 Tax=Heliocybe sulcata TaxID=5364 RepID=A0A5C3NFY1_9AGAM|nr:hypothetical protein OE88DRAFT_1650269 [Heliocybe sulcata]
MAPNEKVDCPPLGISSVNLAVEVWLIIFRWATWPPPHLEHPAEYHPFAPPSHEGEYADMVGPLAVKRTLALVCKQWRQMTLPLLYEFLVLNSREQVLSLGNVLDGHEEYRGYVQTVLLRPLGPLDGMRVHPRDVLEILGRCPNILTIMKPWWLAQPTDYMGAAQDHSHYLHEPAHPSLIPGHAMISPALTRLEWEHTRHGDAALFYHFTHHSPKLRYLYLSRVSLWNGRMLDLERPLAIPTVTTLRLNVRNSWLFHSIRKWRLPALTHLLIESIPSDFSQIQMQALVQAFSSTPKVVELGAHMRLMLTDCITPILRSCQSLDTIALYISFAELPDVDKHPQTERWAVKHVRVHIKPNPFSADTHPGLPVVPSHVLRFARWCTRLAGLEVVTFHDDWQAVLTNNHKALVEARRILKGSGWRIEHDDGRLVEFLDDA